MRHLTANYSSLGFKLFGSLLLAGALLQTNGVAAETAAAQIIQLQGLTTIQSTGAPPRFAVEGDALHQGETIATSNKGYAVLVFKDGGRVSLRPGTIFGIDSYKSAKGEESALISLLKGGMRALSGVIGKANPDAYKVRTPVATIGIRGTDFDVRLCENDCDQESKLIRQPPQVPSAVIARVVLLKGKLSATTKEGISRQIIAGGPVYEHDTLSTGPETHAVLAFSDQGRTTLGSNTVFRIDEYRFKGTQDGAVMRLVRGTLRTLTGLIGKNNPASVSLHTPVATIGIRGTGLDLVCTGACAEPQNPGTAAPGGSQNSGLFVHTWNGQVFLRSGEQIFEIPLNQTAYLGGSGFSPMLLPNIPEFILQSPLPRPDQIVVDHTQLFGTTSSKGPGLYVAVRDGHVSVVGENGQVDLGRNETAFIALDHILPPMRLERMPNFILADPVPLPASQQENGQRPEIAPNHPADQTGCEIR